MKKFVFTQIACFALAVSANAQFTYGNLAVLRAGDGVQTLANTGNSVFIDQFTTGGSYVNSVTIPNSGASALVIGGNSSSEGALVRSSDGLRLTFMGYNLTVGIPYGSAIANTTGATVARGVGQVNAAGAYNLAFTETTLFVGNGGATAGNPRSVVNDGGNNYWGVGSGNAASTRGLGYLGTASGLASITNGQSPRVVDIVGGNLTYSSQTASAEGIYQVTGTPTSGLQYVPLFLPTGASSSPYDFAFNAGMSLAYVADDRTAAGGGIQRWDWNGSSWTLTYTLSTGTGTGGRGLAVDFSGVNPILYATTTETSANRLITITDTGAGSIFSTLSTAGANQVYRGLEFAPGVVPEPSTAALLGVGLLVVWNRFRSGRKV